MSRRRHVVALTITVAIGAASRILPLGHSFWDKSVGDIAYATMVGLLLAIARPRTQPINLAAMALVACFAIELFQATGIPARAPRIVQIVLGTTFAWHDIFYYMVGASIAAVIHDRLGALRSRGASRGSPSK